MFSRAHIGLLWMIALAPLAHAGGEVSGGADTYVVTSAYFRSDDPKAKVQVCYELAPGFGIPAAEVEKALTDSFQQWGQYIETKALHYAGATGQAAIVSQLSPLQAGCQGSEDLRVYLGVTNAEVQKQRPHYFNPYAYSGISQTSADKLWSKGFLWIAGPGEVDATRNLPTWKIAGTAVPYGAFRALMLHEIGHIFGNGHVDHTIMTTRIGQYLEGWTDPQASPFGPQVTDLRIDQLLELVPTLSRARAYSLATTYGMTTQNGVSTPDNHALEKAFTRLFGKAPLGALSAKAVRAEKPGQPAFIRPDRVDGGVGDIRLEFTDAAGLHVATLKTSAKLAQKDESTPLFNGQHHNHYRSFAASFRGSVATPAGTLNAIVNFNMTEAFSVVDLDQGTFQNPLLVSLDSGEAL